MKTIIVATDFSENALSALNYAAALAARINTKIILFNAYQLPLHASNTLITPAGVDALMESTKKRLQVMADKTAANFGIEVEVAIKHIILTEALDELVEEVNAGLVVLGIHENDWSDHYFGNTTTEVIRNASYPLLVVPEKAVYHPIEKVLYAFDPNCLSSRNSLPLLKEIAAKFGASVQVFHVVLPNKPMPEGELQPTNHEHVESALDTIAHHYKHAPHENIVEGIVEEIESYQPQLLAVVPHRLNMWERLLNQSNTRRLALKTKIPLLILPNENNLDLN